MCNGIQLSKSSKELDFGPGFYTTPQKEFARITGELRVGYRHNKGNIAVLEFETNDDIFELLYKKVFFKPTDEWARFIIANRCKNFLASDGFDNNRDQKYDIVIGDTADGKRGMLTFLCEDVARGIRTLSSISTEDVYPSKASNWGEQWSFHTKRALTCISFKSVVYYPCEEVRT